MEITERIQSIPIDPDLLVNYARRVKDLTTDQREDMRQSALRELPNTRSLQGEIDQVTIWLCYETEFYRRAGLGINDDSSSSIIGTAVTLYYHYMLKPMYRINAN